MQCPKCHASMHTYNRSGVQIEQCSGCRGIFLDYGELEALTQLEAQWSQGAYPPPAAWGAEAHVGHGGSHYKHYGHGHHHHSGGLGHLLFSSSWGS